MAVNILMLMTRLYLGTQYVQQIKFAYIHISRLNRVVSSKQTLFTIPKSHTKADYPFRKAVQATRNRLLLGTVARPALSLYPGIRRTRPIST